VAAKQAGEAAKAYIYLSQYAMAILHPKDGIATHPQISKIDAGDRTNANKIAAVVLKRVEGMKEEIKAEFVKKVRARARSQLVLHETQCR
jgi:hypothetical protein